MVDKRPIKTLVIDDEDIFREDVVDYLGHEGPATWGVVFEVRGAKDPQEADRVVVDEGFAPDVIVLDNDFADIGLSDNEGIDRILPRTHLWKAQTGGLADLKVIIVSGRFAGKDKEELRRKAYGWGAHALAEKRGLIEQDRLIPLILKHLGLRP